MVVVQLLSFILCATITVSLSVQAKFLDIHNTNISGLGPQQVFVLPCTTNVTSMGNLLTRSGIIYTHNRWRILNVFIDPVYNAAQRTLIIQTVDSYKNILPCVTFHFYPPGVTPSGDYVHVVNKDGCWSYIGKIGGRQEMSLSISGGCVNRASILHEFGHALGLGHEHQRVDRDTHVNIHWENIDSHMHQWFQKLDSNYWSDFGVAYNVKSIMHYGSWSFSNWKGPTMTTKTGATFAFLDQLQPTDISKLRIMYNC